jgi:sterol desaturase/sphingolipid hydroxylase (fatty acid hydroxylase superfamily)
MFGEAQQRLFEGVVQPFLFHFGMANLLEDGYTATGWLLVGLLQIAVMVAVIVPLQRWRPVEPVVDRQAIRVDILYTLIHRLGIFRLALFFTIDPLWDALMGRLHVWGMPGFHLDDIWPGVTDNAWVSLLMYLVVFDLVEYWIHRGQHGFTWWWKLHAVHHSQRQMTVWSDNRNHLLDDVIHDAIIVLVAQLIGVAPGQFVAIVALTQLSESFQHANAHLVWPTGRAPVDQSALSPPPPRHRYWSRTHGARAQQEGARQQLRRIVALVGHIVWYGQL